MMSPVYQHEQFITTSPQGLNRQHPAMRLFQKAKKLGTWDPCAIDLTADRENWMSIEEREREVALRFVSLFQAGEESVTQDILPLLMTVAREGRMEEEIFLTAFLWEEAKHVEFMRRFLDEVAQTHQDLSHYHTPSYRQIFYELLPHTMNRLIGDHSPEAQAEASVLYNMIVEGVLAETGYYAAFEAFRRNGLFPGLVQGLGLMMRDEARHIAYGVFLLSRLIAEHDQVWELIQTRMAEWIMPALGVVQEVFEQYEPDMPYGLERESFIHYAMNQFDRRYKRLERSHGQSIEQIYRMADQAMEEEPAVNLS